MGSICIGYIIIRNFIRFLKNPKNYIYKIFNYIKQNLIKIIILFNIICFILYLIIYFKTYGYLHHHILLI